MPIPRPQLTLHPSANNLRWLAMIRLIVIGALTLVLGYGESRHSGAGFIYPLQILLVASYALLTLLTFARLRFKQRAVGDGEYFIQLLLDLVIISALLYFSGGASNAFVSYYLVPLTISAAILPWRYTWVIAGISIAAYTLMLFYYQPLPTLAEGLAGSAAHHHGGGNSDGGNFNQHILGMWINFGLSAGLITYFVVKMANALRLQQRQQQEQQRSAREDRLRDQQILAVASLAAGTAHELGTPLNTMTVLVDDMAETPEHNIDQELQQDLQLLQQQLTSCRQILRKLVSTAESHSQGHQQQYDLEQYIRQLLSHWQVLRPDAEFRLTVDGGEHPAQLVADSTLEQAIVNLLNNGADASSQPLLVTLSWSNETLQLEIRDHGPGVSAAISEQIGQPNIDSSKEGGLGLGLLLTHATVSRYGGELNLYNHSHGGAVARLSLPLSKQEDRHQ